MVCRNCGKENLDTLDHCIYCKTKLNNIDKQTKTEKLPENNNTEQTVKKRKPFTVSLPECIIYTVVGILLISNFKYLINFILPSQDVLESFVIVFFVGIPIYVFIIIVIPMFMVLVWFIYVLKLSKKLKKENKKIWLLPILIYITIVIISTTIIFKHLFKI